MSEVDAGKKAEKPEWNRKTGGGTAEDTTPTRQARTVRGGKAEEETPSLIEEVLRRENMVKAPSWSFELAGRASEARVFVMNRRVRNRTHGGVGAGGGQPPPAT